MDRPDLAVELEERAAEDLAVREQLAATGALFQGYNDEMRALHRRNGDRLSEVLDAVGRWPGFALVGHAGSAAAFLIAQHDIANPTLMRRCRDLYATAVDINDAEPSKLAALEDRIRYFEGHLQIYGTQLGWDELGKFGVWPPIDAPDQVDERRSRLGLGALAEALRAAQKNRPSERSVDQVQRERQQADEFAHRVGWRG